MLLPVAPVFPAKTVASLLPAAACPIRSALTDILTISLPLFFLYFFLPRCPESHSEGRAESETRFSVFLFHCRLYFPCLLSALSLAFLLVYFFSIQYLFLGLPCLRFLYPVRFPIPRPFPFPSPSPLLRGIPAGNRLEPIRRSYAAWPPGRSSYFVSLLSFVLFRGRMRVSIKRIGLQEGKQCSTPGYFWEGISV